jgi:hypothetical protein
MIISGFMDLKKVGKYFVRPDGEVVGEAAEQIEAEEQAAEMLTAIYIGRIVAGDAPEVAMGKASEAVSYWLTSLAAGE